MIKVTIQLKKSREQITIICDVAKCLTKNSVSCYDYTRETVEHYDGHIVYVTVA